MRALLRTGADSYYRQGGEECEVIGTEQVGGRLLFRVRLVDETELWAERSELVLEDEEPEGAIDPAQGALPGLDAGEAIL